ncbi:hypothetical protein ElyMa_003176600 [Elysia marginata]|uniref:Uncharacterized protein n=1 Tax=Elysia marginata TaxID=1093978 RepID=A0AAV4J0L6_9GAST|nr:hypothetical protein ElyMa_003176600 [Elysia marginata]
MFSSDAQHKHPDEAPGFHLNCLNAILERVRKQETSRVLIEGGPQGQLAYQTWFVASQSPGASRWMDLYKVRDTPPGPELISFSISWSVDSVPQRPTRPSSRPSSDVELSHPNTLSEDLYIYTPSSWIARSR